MCVLCLQPHSYFCALCLCVVHVFNNILMCNVTYCMSVPSVITMCNAELYGDGEGMSLMERIPWEISVLSGRQLSGNI